MEDELRKEVIESGTEFVQNLINYGHVVAISKKNKIGQIRSNVLNGIMAKKENFDIKAKIILLATVTKGIILTEAAIEKVSSLKNELMQYKSEQIEKYREYRLKRENELKAREYLNNQKMAERLQNDEDMRRRKERKREIEETFAQADKEKIKAKFFGFSKKIVGKVNSSKSKLGSIKTQFLEKMLNSSNAVLVRFEQQKLSLETKFINAASSILDQLCIVKNGIIEYKSEQIEKYREYRLKREKELKAREYLNNQKMAERLQNDEDARRRKERKREIEETFAQADKEKIKAQFFGFSKKIVGKVNSSKSKIARLRTTIVQKYANYLINKEQRQEETDKINEQRLAERLQNEENSRRRKEKRKEVLETIRDYELQKSREEFDEAQANLKDSMSELMGRSR